MVNTYDDKEHEPAYSERRVSNINACYDDDDDKGVCYNSVEPEEVEAGLGKGVVVAPNFGSIAVVDSSNVHFGNKTYYQGPVTVLKQTIVSPSEVQKTANATIGNGLPPKDAANRSAIEKVRLALCPGSKRRQLIAAAAAATAVLVLLSLYLSVFLGRGAGGGDHDQSHDDSGSDGIIDGNFLRIRNRSEWLAQPPVETLDDLKTPAPNVIIMHSATEGCFTTAECAVRIRTIQVFHIEGRKWADIGYNYLVGGEGVVYEGRGWDKVGAHSLGWNNVSIGICLVGTFTTIEPTAKQLTATQRLIERGVKLAKIGADYRLLAHSQVQSTESPGRRMLAIMQRWPHWYNSTRPED